MIQDITFKDYCNDKMKFYENLSRFNINDCKVSIPFIIDLDFYKEVDRLGIKELKYAELKKIFKTNFPKTAPIFEYKGPTIYWFKIENANPILNNIVLEKYRTAKDPNKGWWSKYDKSRVNSPSEILYVGKIKASVENRFLQHIGLGHRNTSSMKLKEWASELPDLKLAFYFLELDGNDRYLADIEFILWNQLKPLLGEGPSIN